VQEDDPISEEHIVLEGVDVAELQELAEQGYARAQFNLGFMYEDGLGVTADYKEWAMKKIAWLLLCLATMVAVP